MTTQRSERIPEWSRGDRMRKARSLTGLTAKEFAELIGVSERTVNHAEGDKPVRKITYNAWSMATGVPVAWLESGEGSSAPHPPDPGRSADRLARLTEQKRSRARGGGPTRQYLLPAFMAA